jgi:L-tyrosine C(3)-methyltransferase
MAITEEISTRRPEAPPLSMDGLAFVLFGHSAFQYLNAACELGLFELVGQASAVAKDQIAADLGLAERAADTLLLGCTSLGLLTRHDGQYRVAEVIGDLMRGQDWQRFKDTVAFEQYVTYEGQMDFTESLRRNTNVGLRRMRGTSSDLYHRLSENPHVESVFYRYMRSWSELANRHLVAQLDLSGAHSLLDCGGGDAVNAIELARANPELTVSVLEIGPTVPIAEKRIIEAGLADRIAVHAGDMFKDPFPLGHDYILFAHQLVIWTLEDNKFLLRKAYDALPRGGRVVIFNSMSNDSGDGPLVAALDSVYFTAIPAEGGMIYSWVQHEECLRQAGFSAWKRYQCPGWTPHGIILAEK